MRLSHLGLWIHPQAKTQCKIQGVNNVFFVRTKVLICVLESKVGLAPGHFRHYIQTSNEPDHRVRTLTFYC